MIMQPGDAVEVNKIWASVGALGQPSRRWFSGYTFVRQEPDGCMIVRIETGTFAGGTVRYPANKVRPVKP